LVSVRLLQLAVSEAEVDDVLAVVDDYGLGHTVLEGAGPSSGQAIVHVLAPADAVEHLLNDLADAGHDTGTYMASLDAEFARFEGVDEVQNTWNDTPNGIAPATLRSKAKDLRLDWRSYVWMMVLSAVVATGGLLQSSAAVVVGSMVLAPIVSPVLTASVATVRNDRDMLLGSIRMQAAGLAVAIATAGLAAWLAKAAHVVPVELAVGQMQPIALRLSPSIVAIAVGLAAGAAGAFGLSTKGQVSIVGVMIAAALIPTAAAAGIGLAWGEPVIALGATLLLVLSMVAINVGGTAMLFYLEYRPDDVDEPIWSVDDPGQALTVAATLGATVIAVIVVGVLFVQQSGFERDVNEVVGDVIAQPRYADLGIQDVTIEYRAPTVEAPTTVTIELARTQGTAYPDLLEELAAAIADRTGHEVRVELTFVDYHRSTPSEG
jgi:uncharacterized hydrophobic protein (TIGR00271 family)